MARLFNILAAREFTKIQIARYGKKTEHWVNIHLLLRNKIFTVYAAWQSRKYLFYLFRFFFGGCLGCD